MMMHSNSIHKTFVVRRNQCDYNLYGFYPQVLKSGIQIFRAADPDLIHVFHRVNCDRTLDKSQYEMCQGTRYSTYGAAHVLVRTLLENPNILAYKRANP